MPWATLKYLNAAKIKAKSDFKEGPNQSARPIGTPSVSRGNRWLDAWGVGHIRSRMRRARCDGPGLEHRVDASLVENDVSCCFSSRIGVGTVYADHDSGLPKGPPNAPAVIDFAFGGRRRSNAVAGAHSPGHVRVLASSFPSLRSLVCRRPKHVKTTARKLTKWLGATRS